MQVKVGSNYGHLLVGGQPAGIPQVIDPAPGGGGGGGAGNPAKLGDYSTSDYSQWVFIDNSVPNRNPPGTQYNPTSHYQAAIVTDPTYGPVSRYELRQGDRPEWDSSTVDRSEVNMSGVAASGYDAGSTYWCFFRTKFDTSYNTGNNGSWGTLTNQWHQWGGVGSPTLAWFAFNDGYWKLQAQRQSSPGTFIGTWTVWQTLINPGAWHDIKMRIYGSTSDGTGEIELWHNGVHQTNLYPGGATVCNVRTCMPSDTATYYKEGIYRATTPPTAVIFHHGFNCAATEADLKTSW